MPANAADGGRHPERARHQGKYQTNFGCAHPEGYRKALRIMGMANRFGLPIVCLIDTAGAYPAWPPKNATLLRPLPLTCAR